MPTPSERRALLFVAAVAALGLGLRGLRALRPLSPIGPEREALASQIAAVDSAVTRSGRARAGRRDADASPSRTAGMSARASSLGRTTTRAPEQPPAAVDLDRATEDELDALPGIGPALARRILEHRSNNGPFGSLDALQEVRGIGPALAAKLAPLVTFSGPPRPPPAKASGSGSLHP